jgi:hypothetical protein
MQLVTMKWEQLILNALHALKRSTVRALQLPLALPQQQHALAWPASVTASVRALAHLRDQKPMPRKAAQPIAQPPVRPAAHLEAPLPPLTPPLCCSRQLPDWPAAAAASICQHRPRAAPSPRSRKAPAGARLVAGSSTAAQLRLPSRLPATCCPLALLLQAIAAEVWPAQRARSAKLCPAGSLQRAVHPSRPLHHAVPATGAAAGPRAAAAPQPAVWTGRNCRGAAPRWHRRLLLPG